MVLVGSNDVITTLLAIVKAVILWVPAYKIITSPSAAKREELLFTHYYSKYLAGCTYLTLRGEWYLPIWYALAIVRQGVVGPALHVTVPFTGST